MADLRNFVEISDSSPEEAAENINKAREFGTTPEMFKESKQAFSKALEDRNRPEFPEVAAQRAVQSTEHAKVMDADRDIFDTISKYGSIVKKSLSNTDINRDLNQIDFKIATGKELDQDQKFEYNKLLREQKDLGDIEQDFLLDSMNVAYDFGLGVWDQKGVIASGAAALGLGGGLAGAGLGLLTPVGVGRGFLFGARQGAIAGAKLGFYGGLLWDGYVQGVGQTYRTMKRVIPPGATPADEVFAERERRSLAVGAGVFMGGVAVIPGISILKRTPFLNKLLRPGKYFEQLASTSKGRSLLLDLSKSGLAEAFEEGSQEAVQIVTEEMGKTWDGSETSFVTGWSNAVSQWRSVERIGRAASTGFVGGAAITGGLRALTSPFDTTQRDTEAQTGPMRDVTPRPVDEPSRLLPQRSPAPDVVDIDATPTPPGGVSKKVVTDLVGINTTLPPVVKGTRAVQFKLALDKLNDSQILDSNTNKLLPEEMDIIRERTLEEAGVTGIYMDKETLNEWADTEEKAEDLRSIISEVEQENADLNAPIRLDHGPFLRLVEKYPELTDYVKPEPEDITFSQWKKANEDAATRRAEIESQLPEAKVSTLPEARMRDAEIFNDDDYLSQETFTPEIYDIIPAKESLKYNAAQITARTEVADAIIADRDKRMEAVADAHTEFQLMFEREVELDELQSDERIQTVEDFIGNGKVVESDLTKVQKERLAKGRPVHSINPDSLPERVLQKYKDNETLKKRKVFLKSGVHIDDVLTVYGFDSADQFLKVLSQTPTLNEAVDQNLELRSQEIKQEAIDDQVFENSALANAYNNMTKNHIREMKILKESNWSVVRGGIERIALPLPKFKHLQQIAKDSVGSTKIKDLKVNKWKVAERRSQRKAVRAITRNKVEEAWREKRNAAVNTQLAKETHVSIGKVNKAISFITSLKSRNNWAVLTQAGTVFTDAVNNIMQVYDFDPTQKRQTNIDRYNKYVEQMNKEGRGDETIPEEVLRWLRPTTSAKDLTVDQVLEIEKILRRVFRQAKLKNRLMQKRKAFGETVSSDIIAGALINHIKTNPDFDENKPVIQPADQTAAQKKAWYTGGITSLVKNSNFIFQQLDKGTTAGFVSAQLWAPIEGVAEFEGPYGLLAKTKMLGKFNKKLIKGAEKYGKDIVDAGVIPIDVPEFRGIEGLNNGKVSKMTLMRILMNMGTQGNREAVRNWGIDPEKMMEILIRELDERDFDYVQGTVWNTFKGLKKPIARVEKETKGVDVNFVEPMPFEAFGKTYEGGWFHLRYKRDSSARRIKEMAEDLESLMDPNTRVKVMKSPAYDGIVYAPYLKNRTGSDWTLDVDADVFTESLDMIIHDLTMRVPVRDTMSILARKDVAEVISKTVGPSDYDVLISTIASLTNTGVMHQNLLYRDANKVVSKAFSTIEHGVMVGYISFNPSSLFIGFSSIFEAGHKMGRGGARHVRNTLLSLASPMKWPQLKEMFEFAADIDHTMRTYIEGLDEYRFTVGPKAMPKKRLIKSKKYNSIKRMQEGIVDFSLSGILGRQDMFNKMVAVHSAYSQFKAGDVEGWPLEKLRSMHPDDVENQAKRYAAQISASTTLRIGGQDRAPIQRLSQAKEMSRFWSEPKNKINNRMLSKKRISWSFQEAAEEQKKGNTGKSRKAVNDVGYEVASLISITLMGLIMNSITRGENPFAESYEEEERTNLTDFKITQAPGWFVSRFTTGQGIYSLGKEAIGMHAPIVNSMIWGAETNRGVSFPLFQGMSAIGNTTKYGLLEITDAIGMTEANIEIGDKEMKEILLTTSILTGGLPVSAYFKIRDALEAIDYDPLSPGLVTSLFLAAAGTIIEKFDGVEMTPEEKFEAAKNRRSGGTGKTELQDTVDRLKEMKSALESKISGSDLRPEEYEVIKHAESNGDWNAMSDAGAFGVYQFLKSTWRGVINSPEGRRAGLTELGRTSSDTSQQEIAMRIFTRQNISRMKRNKVPVTLESVYFSHHFGDTRSVDVYKNQPDSKRLPKKFFSSIELEKNPPLRGVKTVGDMKRYIRQALDRGRRVMAKRGR